MQIRQFCTVKQKWLKGDLSCSVAGGSLPLRRGDSKGIGDGEGGKAGFLGSLHNSHPASESAWLSSLHFGGPKVWQV